jgi:hypothetical protein
MVGSDSQFAIDYQMLAGLVNELLHHLAGDDSLDLIIVVGDKFTFYTL